MKIIETTLAISLDWSRCRSPARARRRYQKGHPQRNVWRAAAYKAGDTLYVHPTIANLLRNANLNPEQLEQL